MRVRLSDFDKRFVCRCGFAGGQLLDVPHNPCRKCGREGLQRGEWQVVALFWRPPFRFVREGPERECAVRDSNPEPAG